MDIYCVDSYVGIKEIFENCMNNPLVEEAKPADTEYLEEKTVEKEMQAVKILLGTGEFDKEMDAVELIILNCSMGRKKMIKPHSRWYSIVQHCSNKQEKANAEY